jgi:polyferredoxin
MVQDGRIENVYKVQLMNATERTLRVRIEVAGLPGATLESGGDVEVGPTEARWIPVAVQVPNDAARALGPGAHPMQFRIALIEPRVGAKTAPPDRPAAHELHEKSTFVVPR